MAEPNPLEIAQMIQSEFWAVLLFGLLLVVFGSIILFLVRIRTRLITIDLAEDQFKVFKFPRWGGILFSIITILMAIGLIGGAIPGTKWNPDWSLTPDEYLRTTVTVFSFALAIFWFFPIYLLGMRVVVTSKGVTKISPWKPSKSIEWTDVDYVTYSWIWAMYVVSSIKGKRIWINDGYGEGFGTEARKYIPKERWCPKEKMPKYRRLLDLSWNPPGGFTPDMIEELGEKTIIENRKKKKGNHPS